MFLPPTINLENSEQYILSIRIDPSGFMFSLSKPNDGRNYCLRGTKFEEGSSGSILNNIQKIIFDLNFLTLQYAKTNVIFVSPAYTIAPLELYDYAEKEKFVNFVTQLEEDIFTLTNTIPKYGVESIFQVDESVHNFLSRSLCNPHFYNHSTLLIELFEGRINTVSLHAKMYVNLHDDICDIICFHENKLLLSVTYQGLSANEKTYYILKIWESLALNQMKDQLLIAGEIEEPSLIVLREYIKNIERITAPSETYLWHTDAQKTPLDLIYLSL